MTRAEALVNAHRRLTDAAIPAAEARTEAMLLLRHTTNLSREELFLRPGVSLTDSEAERFGTAIARRARREPLAYITGNRDFYGLTFAVTPDVLIPRPETEGVVEAVLDLVCRKIGSPPTPNPGGWGASDILDLCTGSGCIAIALAVHAPDARITATDISDRALTVARANAEAHGVADRVTLLSGDLFVPVPPGTRFAVIASNPPYIAPDEIAELEPEVRDFEPRIALGVHADALHFYRRIGFESPVYLAEGGSVVVEVGQGQSDAVSGLFRDAGFTNICVLPDLAGIPRVIAATAYRRP
ncbi:MAG: peptide chain release factor N(5)-glutamine methyltransferase [Akkermansiaceae bacterium]|nr:peptide chain release factor N(5)-glutamine methyltransferase [Armatimonadota bacterium]